MDPLDNLHSDLVNILGTLQGIEIELEKINKRENRKEEIKEEGIKAIEEKKKESERKYLYDCKKDAYHGDLRCKFNNCNLCEAFKKNNPYSEFKL